MGVKEANVTQEWQKKLTKEFNSGTRVFVAYLNINDNIVDEKHEESFMSTVLMTEPYVNCSIVLGYDISRGLYFPRDENPKLRSIIEEEEIFEEEDDICDICSEGYSEYMDYYSEDEEESNEPRPSDVGKRWWEEYMENTIGYEESIAREFWDVGTQDPLPREPEVVFPLIESLLKLSRNSKGKVRVGVIIEEADSLFPEGDMGQKGPEDRFVLVSMRQLVNDNRKFSRGNCPILLTSRSLGDIHPSLRDPGAGIGFLQIPFPDREQRRQHWETLYRQHGNITPEIDTGVAAHLTRGLKIKDLNSISKEASDSLMPISVPLIKAKREELFRASAMELLSLVDTEDCSIEYLGGISHVKRYFDTHIFPQWKGGDVEAKKTLPRSLGYVGAPGTGKTEFAKACAKMCDVPLLQLSFSGNGLFSKWVGETEKNIAKICEIVKAMAPVHLFIDEIDLLGADRTGASGDSGVGKRVLEQLLNFLTSIEPGEVLVQVATNRPDSLDPAFRRRIEEWFLFPLPDMTDMETVLQAVYRRNGWGEIEKEKAKEVVRIMGEAHSDKELTGAFIAQIARKASQISRQEGESTPNANHLKEAVARFIPSDTSQYREYEKIGREAVNDIMHLPARLRPRKKGASKKAPTKKENKTVEGNLFEL